MLYPDDVNGATSCIDSIIQDVSVYKKIDYAATIGSWSIKNISASSEARWHQRASNAFDNDKLTYWEPKNSSKEWIQASLSTSVTIQGVQIKFYRGDLRIYNIEILGSKDGVNWETYFSGNSQLSGDLTSNFIFDEEKQFSYFKVITNGSDVSRQNGIFEIIPSYNFV